MCKCKCGKEMSFISEVLNGSCAECEFALRWEEEQKAWYEDGEVEDRGDAFDDLAKELKVAEQHLPW